MARCRRGEVVRADEVGVYHCVQRVVRRAALCGADAVTGLDLGHRRDWIRGRLEELAGAFAVEIAAFAVMDNHLHVVARIRPDLAAAWSDAEVVARWLAIFPGPAELGRPASEPSAPVADLAAIAGGPSPAESMILADPARLAEVRRRLADLSWPERGHPPFGPNGAAHLLGRTGRPNGATRPNGAAERGHPSFGPNGAAHLLRVLGVEAGCELGFHRGKGRRGWVGDRIGWRGWDGALQEG